MSPSSTFESSPFRFFVIFFGIDPFIQVARHVVDAKIAFASRSFATQYALIEAKKFGLLDGFVLRINLIERWLEPRIVDVANVGIAFVSVRKGFFGGAFTCGNPFAFPAQAFSAFLAERQSVIPIDHDGRMRTGAIGVFVAVNAIPLAAYIGEALLRVGGEFVTNDDVIGSVV